MNDIRGISGYTGRCLFFSMAIVMTGCAQDTGVRDSAGTGTTSGTEQPSKAQADQTRSSQAEDARFMTAEEQGVKMWKPSGPGRVDSASNTITVNAKDRGTKPLQLKVTNSLSAEHGFAIDTMNVKEVLKPGEERTISIPMENIEPSTTRHRVYCQIHEKHGAATLIISKDPSSTAETGTMDPAAHGRSSSDVSRPSQSRQDERSSDTIRPSQSRQDERPSDTMRPSQSRQDERPSDSTRPSQSRQEAGSMGSGSQSGEASSTMGSESDGQRMIREQSQRQREIESTSRTENAPSSINPQACDGFPGFDRGCPGGPR